MAGYNVAARLQKLVLDGYLERVIQDAMVPELRFREAVSAEKLSANAKSGTILKSREGLPSGSMVPLGGATPPDANYQIEQWPVDTDDYGQKLPLSLRDNSFTIANMIVRYTRQQTIAAVKSVEGLLANAAYKAAGWGHSFVGADASATTTIQVTSLLGLGYKHDGSGFKAVSASNKLAATLHHGGADVAINIVGVTPADASLPDGPGTITVDAAVDVSKNDYLYTEQATYMVTANGKDMDSLTSGDSLTLQQIMNAAGILSAQGVPTFRDGTYHCHLSQLDMDVLMQDSNVKNLLTGNMLYAEGNPQLIGRIANITFIRFIVTLRTTTCSYSASF
jgi:hypothetical protein